MRYAPKAIVTICIEDRANLAQTVAEIKATAAAANYDPILKPTDWFVNDTQQDWPTLGWMRKNNKRLVIFTQRGGNSSHTWQQYRYCIENQYSTLDPNELYNERAESARNAYLPRNNVIFNHFNDIVVTQSTQFTKEQVRYDNVRDLIKFCQSKRFANGKVFNGYYIDRVVDSCNDLEEDQIKTIFDYVNELNK
jgi:hypothetical protein